MPETDRKPNLLLLDADAVVRHVLAEYLRDCGYRVLEASTGQEAVSLLSEQIPFEIDVVLLDADLPGKPNGFELQAWIRHQRPDLKLVTVGSAVAAVEKASDICHDGPSLQKPYDHALVLQRLKQLSLARKGHPER